LKVSEMDEKDVETLMQDAGIIRNRLKILSIIKNAKAFIKIQREFGSFDKYFWGFVNGKPIVNKITSSKEIPTRTNLSDQISKDLKARGLSFVGSTIVYAFMQAVGMVNDHEISCFRYKKV